MESRNMGRRMFRPIAQVVTVMVATDRLSEADAETLLTVIIDRLQDLGWRAEDATEEAYEYRNLDPFVLAFRSQGIEVA